MNGPVLTLLAAIIVVLPALGALGAVWRRAGMFVGFAMAGLAGVGAIAALLSLLLDNTALVATLPIGPPGAPLHLALDPLAASFSLLLLLPAALALLISATPAACFATLALVFLAGDGLTLAIGILLSTAALWHASDQDRNLLLSGTAMPVAAYLLLRLLVDRAGALPPWCSLPPLLLGALATIGGGIAATRRSDIDGVLAAGTLRQAGLAAIALGVVLAARAADLPGVAALAFAAVLLLAATQALAGTLAVLATNAIRRAASTNELDRLGGLIHRMPATSGCLLAALISSTTLPPGVGFAAIWLLFQALLALPRGDGLLQALLVATLGLGAALSVAAGLRLFGMVCLGRPRMPRTEGAREVTQVPRLAMLSLAALSALAGALAGPTAFVLADSPLRAILGSGLEGRASLVGLAPGLASRGYAALPIAMGLALVGAAVFCLRQRYGRPAAAASGRAWDGGFAPPFARMYFAEPTTQTAGAGFTPFPPLPAWSWRKMPRLRWRLRAPIVMLAGIALWLLLCVWAGVT